MKHKINQNMSGFLEVDGFKLQYQTVGKGKPAIVVGGALYYPRCFSENLAKNLQLTCMDHRVYAPYSQYPDDQSYYLLDKIVDDIEKLRLKLNLDKIIIIGHSGHSYMALEYAKKYPKHVDSILMIAITPSLNNHYHEMANNYFENSASRERKEAEKSWQNRITDEDLGKLKGKDWFIKNYVRSAPKIWYDEQFDAEYLWEGCSVNVPMFEFVWGKQFSEIDIFKDISILEENNLKTLLVLGKYDYICGPVEVWDNDVISRFPNLKIEIIEKSGHTPMLEDSKIFDKSVIRFISSPK